MDPTARFTEIVRASEVRLDEGALLIAAHARPGLDVGAQCRRLDDLALGCPAATLEGLRQYLFEELGFRGDEETYGDPANSYLDRVLDRRLGIPITLSVVAMEVGRRVGVHLGGVGMPGHFLVQSLDEPELFIDVFAGGRFLGPPECREIFARVQGDEASFSPDLLAVVDHRAILWRMLSNLRAAFAHRGRLRDLRWVLELQLAFPQVPAAERRRVARLLASVGRLDRAADTLEEVAEGLEGSDASKTRRQARVLRSRLN